MPPRAAGHLGVDKSRLREQSSDGTGNKSATPKLHGLERLRAFQPAEPAIEGAKRQLARLACHFEHQAI